MDIEWATWLLEKFVAVWLVVVPVFVVVAVSRRWKPKP